MILLLRCCYCVCVCACVCSFRDLNGVVSAQLVVFFVSAQHILDKLAKLQRQVASDAEAHDSNFSSFCWDISEKNTSEMQSSATPGVIGW